MKTEQIQARVDGFLALLPFVQGLGITVAEVSPGSVTVEMPFAQHHSSAPAQFPASVVGAIGDVAAIASCLSLVPDGWAVSTLDFTVKMTNPARGSRLRATGSVMQSGRTLSTARADIWALDGATEVHGGAVLATGRSFPIR